jgi:antitoxin VapB
MAQSTVFKSNKTQAVRIPKSVALPDHVKHVDVIKRGNARLIVPAGGTWEEFFDGPRIDKDFMSARQQPPPQDRSEG